MRHVPEWNEDEGNKSGDVTMALSTYIVLESLVMWGTPFVIPLLVNSAGNSLLQRSRGWNNRSLPPTVCSSGKQACKRAFVMQ